MHTPRFRFWLTLPAVAAAVASLIAVFPRADAQATRTLRASGSLDRELRGRLERAGVRPLDPGPRHSDPKVLLGQLLFFDKELSGNRDMACATCHHPDLVTGDMLPLSIGTAATGGIGPFRELGDGRPFIPRNAPEVFNRGSTDWTSNFWDSRVAVTPDGKLVSPAGDKLPAGLESVLAVQAMFPVTSRDEMRGRFGDFDVDGNLNELALYDDGDLQGIWDALMDRLLAIPEYRLLFAAAYPDIAEDQLGFEDVANAIAAFEATAFTFPDSPFDRYLAGDRQALSTRQKRGAALFFGEARCWKCHSGSLLTDQEHYNIGVPQLGPGKAPHNPFDLGRFGQTGKKHDMFAFRTPPLRNVAVTGPWMHNGAYSTLEGAVRHHLNPERALLNYDSSQLDSRLRDTVMNDPITQDLLLMTLAPEVSKPIRLSDAQVGDLLAFLNALTSPSLIDLPMTIPAAVPSGLPVDELFP
jgi:cytochrome c peroxidase